MPRKLALVAVVVALLASVSWLVYASIAGAAERPVEPPGGTLRVVDAREGPAVPADAEACGAAACGVAW